jgi:threonine dehydrogenase-like Zn-dependent dehydrogenase
MRLEGKRIMITGGGSGIGLALARRLADANRVVIAGRDEAKLERARTQTPKLRTLRVDVTSESEAREAITRIGDELGLDLLVNNAGLLRAYPLSSANAETWSVEDVEANIGGVLRMTRLALPLHEASPEAGLAFVSSADALAAVPGYAVYGATKAAVVRDLNVPKLPPAAVADAIITGLQRDREEIRVARVRQLAPPARIMPRLADRIVTRALTPRADDGQRRDSARPQTSRF